MISLHKQIRIAGGLARFPPLQFSPGGGEGRTRAGLMQLEGWLRTDDGSGVREHGDSVDKGFLVGRLSSDN